MKRSPRLPDPNKVLCEAIMTARDVARKWVGANFI